MTTYTVPGYWLDGYVEGDQFAIILLGARNPWRQHQPFKQEPKPQAKPTPPQRTKREPIKMPPMPSVRASLANSIDRSAMGAAKPPPAVRSSLASRR